MNRVRRASMVTGAAKGLLGYVPLYVGLQRLVGADRLRLACIDRLDLRPGARVLDVGCGPAYYLDRLPAVDYVGIDTDCHYIDWARNRWGPRGVFRCEELTPATATDLGPFDTVLLMGVLHHLDDAQCDALLAVLAANLTPHGRVVSLDTTYHAGQSRVSRWMADNDRGQHVRHPPEWNAMAERHFACVQGSLLTGLTRIPSSYWVMQMERDRAPTS